ncbi:MAG: nitroreductase family protein [Candidatus Hodarchaeales archaeon]|jgi:nitroreductase
MNPIPKMENPIDLIQSRTSIRTYYSSISLDEQINLINHFIDQLSESPFFGSARFEVVELQGVKKLQKLRLGTYGFVKRADKFIIGIITKPSQYDLENIGFLFECLVLYITSLGLGTVWLGGTFSRKAFTSHMKLSEGERIPVISPIGRIAQKQNLRSRVIKSIAGSKTRRPWRQIFFDSNFDTPLTIADANEFSTPLEMVRLSPSASNFQPWRVVKKPQDNIFHFFIYRKSPRSHTLVQWPDFSRIDLGIAVSHFDLTAKQLNLVGEWRVVNPEFPGLKNMEYLISWVSK